MRILATTGSPQFSPGVEALGLTRREFDLILSAVGVPDRPFQAGIRHEFPVQRYVSRRRSFCLVNMALSLLSGDPLTRRVK
jgi:hypothetical protein